MSFEINILGTNSPINEGESVEVEYEVTNSGSSTETQDVTLEVGDTAGDIDTIDTFSGGVNSSWNNSSYYNVVEDGGASEASAAHRTTGDYPLTASSNDFGRAFTTGSYFLNFTVKSTSSSNQLQFLFGGNDYHWDNTETYELLIDYDLQSANIRETTSNITGWNSLTTNSVNFPTGEYVQVIGHRDADNFVQFDFYNASGSKIGEIGNQLSRESGGYWGFNPNSNTSDLLIGDVRFNEYHPHTGIRYDEDQEANYNTAVVDNFDNGSLSLNWVSTENYSVTSDVAAKEDYAAYRTDTIGRMHADYDSFTSRPRPGGFFNVATIRDDAGGNGIQVVFHGTRDTSTTWGWTSNLDVTVGNGQLRVRMNDDGTWTDTSDTYDNAALSGNYATLVTQYGSNDIVEAILYDTSDVEIARTQMDVSSYSNADEQWGVSIYGSDDQTRCGSIESHERNPINGKHHDEDPVVEDSGSDSDATYAIDMDDYSSLSEAYDDTGSSSFAYHSRSTQNASSGSASVMADNYASSSNNSNCNISTMDRGDGQPRIACQSTMMYLHPDFELGSADDLHNVRFMNAGLNRNYGPAHSGGDGPPSGDDGWSIRPYIMCYDQLDGPFGLNMYVYHMDQSGGSGESDRVYQDLFYPGTWHEFVCTVELNTVTDGSANADGVGLAWVDGNLIYDRRDFRWDTTDEQAHDELGFGNRTGGSEVPPTEYADIWFDEHEIWLGSDVPSEYTP